MCGRFGFFELSYFIEQLRELDLTFDEAPGFGYRQSWNITLDSMIVTLLGDHGRYRLGMAHWGLIPHWSAEMPTRRPINARAESFAARPFFRHMLNRRHCHHTGQWLLRMEACQGASQGAVVHPSER